MSKKATLSLFYRGRYFGEYTMNPQNIKFDAPAGSTIRDAVNAAIKINTLHKLPVHLVFNDVKICITDDQSGKQGCITKNQSKNQIVQNAIDAYFNTIKQR